MRISALLSGAALAASAMFATSGATAQTTIATNAEYTATYTDGSPDIHVTDPQSTDSGAYIWSYASGNMGSADGYSSRDGILGAHSHAGGYDGGTATFASATPQMMAADFGVEVPTDPYAGPSAVHTIGTASWESVISNDSDSARDYTFLFHVYDSYLNTTIHDGNWAAISLDIQLNGNSIYQGNASMVGAELTYSSIFAPYLDPFRNGSDGDAHFYAFDAGVDLGTLVAGDSFTLTYNMVAETYATMFEGDYSSSYAAIGDPFGWETEGGIQILSKRSPGTGDVVPEPATWAMMIAGFGLVGAAARRRKLAHA